MFVEIYSHKGRLARTATFWKVEFEKVEFFEMSPMGTTIVQKVEFN